MKSARLSVLSSCVLATTLFAAASHAQSGIDARATNTTLLIESSQLTAAPTYEFERVFPRLELPPIVKLRQFGNEFYALAINGLLFSFPAETDPDPSSLQLRLNVQSLLGTTEPQDQGTYCFAFDPNFAENSKVYINYASNVQDRLTLSRFTLGGDPVEAAASEELLLRADVPTAFLHYGGTVEFGPDGFLYFSTGDGNRGINAQEPNNLLGKMLRLDVTSETANPYAIPASNPFVGVAGYREEIYALGLRNPYRFSFAPDGRIFLGDPGEEVMEEVNIVEKGGNYGWPFLEGTGVHENSLQADRADLKAPFHTYNPEGRQAIIGGYVYTGAIDSLSGKYLFGDFSSGNLIAITMVENTVTSKEVLASIGGLLGAVHEDAAGEIYATNFAPPSIFRLRTAPQAVSVENQVQGLLGEGTVVDLNTDGVGDAADVNAAVEGRTTTFFSRTN